MIKEEKEKDFEKLISLIENKIKESKDLFYSNVLYIQEESSIDT